MKKENVSSIKNGFSFTHENLKKAKDFIAMYPEKREASAVMSLLYLVQEQHRWIPDSAIYYIADLINVPYIQVYEVVNFYTMYNLRPVGKYLIQVCRTTPCWLCGSDKVLNAFKRILDIDVNDTTSDNLFTLKEVECLGACINSPVVQINNDFYEDLDEAKVKELIEQLSNKSKNQKIT
ncbi:NADH-quinone oxidoreductase subunit NuoE [Wolbachia endosymbiont of Pentidionis agamae]|uniref:NADH-quinone oxidoreductase subunit NuoE n=1 Tax=Wolbachia endosymbiont of Pentidionis agamae TaxID=3110435 RepID=UPI002FD04724